MYCWVNQVPVLSLRLTWLHSAGCADVEVAPSTSHNISFLLQTQEVCQTTSRLRPNASASLSQTQPSAARPAALAHGRSQQTYSPASCRSAPVTASNLSRKCLGITNNGRLRVYNQRRIAWALTFGMWLKTYGISQPWPARPAQSPVP